MAVHVEVQHQQRACDDTGEHRNTGAKRRVARARVIAEKPMSVVDGKPLVSKFRAGDIREEKPVRKIKQFINSPDQPL